jgi:hypothetical protein
MGSYPGFNWQNWMGSHPGFGWQHGMGSYPSYGYQNWMGSHPGFGYQNWMGTHPAGNWQGFTGTYPGTYQGSQGFGFTGYPFTHGFTGQEQGPGYGWQQPWSGQWHYGSMPYSYSNYPYNWLGTYSPSTQFWGPSFGYQQNWHPSFGFHNWNPGFAFHGPSWGNPQWGQGYGFHNWMGTFPGSYASFQPSFGYHSFGPGYQFQQGFGYQPWQQGFGYQPHQGFGYQPWQQGFGYQGYHPFLSQTGGYQGSGFGPGAAGQWGGPYSHQFGTAGLPTDEQITEMIYDALDADPLIPWDTEIDINVDAGTVTLTGTVPNKRIKHAAGDDAWWINGVVDVHNNLDVAARRRGARTMGATESSTGDQTQQPGHTTRRREGQTS